MGHKTSLLSKRVVGSAFLALAFAILFVSHSVSQELLDDWLETEPISFGAEIPGATGISLAYSKGYLYAIGGATGTGNNPFQILHKTVYRGSINPTGEIESWSAQAEFGSPAYITSIAFAGTATSSTGWIYVTAGRVTPNENSGATYYALPDANGNINNWTKATLPDFSPRLSAPAVILNDRLYVIGGLGQQDSSLDVKDEVVFTEIEPMDAVWTPTTQPLPFGRYGSSAVVLNGRIYVIGGIILDQYNNPFPVNLVQFAEPDSATGDISQWYMATATLTPNPKEGLALMAAVTVTQTNKIYVLGGWQVPGSNTAIATVFSGSPNSTGDITQWNSEDIKDLPEPLLRHSATFAQNGSIYVVGGQNTTGGGHRKTVYYLPVNPDRLVDTSTTIGETQGGDKVTAKVTNAACRLYNFSAPQGDWQEADNANTKFGYIDGEFQLLAKNPTMTHLSWPKGKYENYDISVKARWADVSARGEKYGLTFGVADNLSSFYTFMIYSESQKYEIQYYHGSWTLLESGQSEAINTGLASNYLSVERSDGKISIAVNDTPLTTIEASQISGKRHVGVGVGPFHTSGVADARFDDYQICSFDEGGGYSSETRDNEQVAGEDLQSDTVCRSDDFSDQNSGWMVGSHPEADYTYTTSQEYNIYSKQVNNLRSVSPFGSFSNYTVKVDARWVDPELGDEYGIIFGIRGKDSQRVIAATSLYRFIINTRNNREFSLRGYDGNKWYSIIDWTINNVLINGDTDLNTLEVRCDGSSVSLYANSNFLWRGPVNCSGEVGITSNPSPTAINLNARFDNFEVCGQPETRAPTLDTGQENASQTNEDLIEDSSPPAEVTPNIYDSLLPLLGVLITGLILAFLGYISWEPRQILKLLSQIGKSPETIYRLLYSHKYRFLKKRLFNALVVSLEPVDSTAGEVIRAFLELRQRQTVGQANALENWKRALQLREEARPSELGGQLLAFQRVFESLKEISLNDIEKLTFEVRQQNRATSISYNDFDLVYESSIITPTVFYALQLFARAINRLKAYADETRPREAILLLNQAVKGFEQSKQQTINLSQPETMAILVTVDLWLDKLQKERQRKQEELSRSVYIVGRPVTEPHRFYGRDEEMRRILNAVQSDSIMLYGPRRIGKTTILHQVKNRLLEQPVAGYWFVPIFVNLQALSEDELFATLVEITRQQIEQDEVDLPTLRLDSKSPHEYTDLDCQFDLSKIIRALKIKWSNFEIRLVWLLDEVDQLLKDNLHLQVKLRTIGQDPLLSQPLRFVLTGLQVFRDSEEYGSPFYNIFTNVELTSLSTEEASRLITQPVQGQFNYDDEAIHLITQVSNAEPYWLQYLCREIILEVANQEKWSITVEDVRTALKKMPHEFPNTMQILNES